MKSFTATPLTDGWEFTQLTSGPLEPVIPKDQWLPTYQFPTEVHVELLKLGKIPDPYIGNNEWEVQWISEVDWAFRKTFKASSDDLAAHADLIFDGLDTFAVVELNGKTILEANNMFMPYRVPVRNLLQEGDNQLVITFPSTFLKGKALEEKHGKNRLWNGDSSRLHVRKAQYSYGWDWGPVLIAIGPWRTISLETYATRITDLRISSTLSEDLTSADVTITVSANASSILTANVTLISPSGKLIREHQGLSLDAGVLSATLSLHGEDLKLWYPAGYGKQPLYEVQVSILQGAAELDSKIQKIGIRRALVVQDDLIDQEGKTFLFEVNGIRVFCGGSNWIPADSFLTTVTPERYRAWLQLLLDGNQSMVRVWGGGIYEHDAFYDICDELGLLVWQDFMFGCGQYPAYPELLKSVEAEAEANVLRLRHHPSIVLFAGNNEDYQVAESLDLELDYADESPESDFLSTNFPARHIYERTLPAVVGKLCDIAYHRGSPYSGYGLKSTDRYHGDLHQWNVWHGSQEPWHNWDVLSGRFVSEFGMQGYPDIRTVNHWIGDDKAERFPQSKTMNNHNKADGFERRLELYLMENFKHAFDIESYVYYTQIMQAETLASAYRLWRREWRGRGKEYTAGALVWQINDCWPVTSWAIVDYFLRPKPAFFTIKRELAPFTVGMTRKESKKITQPDSAAFFAINTELQVWGTNSTLQERAVKVELKAFDVERGLMITEGGWTKDVKLAPNSSTEIWMGAVPGQPIRTKNSERPLGIVVQARIFDHANGEVLARYSNWPEPFKFVHFPSVSDLNFKMAVSGDTVTLSTDRPMKGVVIDLEDIQSEEVQWSDQAIDLYPGDPQTITAIGLNGRKIKARFLGDGTA